MLYRILADAVLLIHLLFIIFAVLGGLLVLKWKRTAWIHVPAFLWAALIEFAGWICPLTPLENWFLEKGGELGYESSFIEHYLLPIIYPPGLTRELQIVFGFVVGGINVAVYGWIIYRTLRKQS